MISYLDSDFKREILVGAVSVNSGVIHSDRILDFHDIIFVISGGWEIWQESECINANPGDVVLLSKGHHHYGITPCEAKTKTIWIHFSASENDGEVENVNCFAVPSIIHCGSGSKVETLLYDTVSAWKSGQDIKADLTLRLALSEISDLFKRKTVGKSYIDEVVDAIGKNPEKSFLPSDFADGLGISDKKLTEDFKAVTGVTFHRFQVINKLKTVKGIIESGEFHKLSDLASDFGFYDEYHLGKVYKDYFGVSPIRKKN